MSLATLPPVAEGLFVQHAGEVRLIGSQCRRCDVVTFPRQGSCPRCTSVDVAPRLLGRRGALWSWTVQCFAPKSPPYAVADPEAFVPFGVGYVELPGEVRIEARLTVADPEQLHIGMPMELTLVPVPGTDSVTYAFAPARDGA